MFHEALQAYWASLPVWAQRLLEGAIYAALVLFVALVVRSLVIGPATKHLEATLKSFLDNIVKVTVWLLVLVAALLGFGVSATALGGLLAVFGFVVGFAMQDTFGNLAAGVMLLMNRPFQVGEAVKMGGEEGIVEALGISMTRLRTWDGRMLVIPNRIILGEAILNFNRNATRRVEIDVGIAYDDPVDTAIQTALETVRRDPRVLTEGVAPPDVLVTALADNSVNLQVRAWVRTPDWLFAKSDLTGRVKAALDAAGISIPFPQRDVQVTFVGGRRDGGDGGPTGGGAPPLGLPPERHVPEMGRPR